MSIVRHISNDTKGKILKVSDGILSAASLFFVFRTVTTISEEYSPEIDYFITYCLLGLSCVLQAMQAFRKDTLTFVKSLCFAALLFTVGTIVLESPLTPVTFKLMTISLTAIIMTNRATAVFVSRKLRYRIISALLALFLLYMIAGFVFFDDESVGMLVMLHAVLASGKALGRILSVSFSQMRISVLRKILRKTFAAEILFGLLLLIVSFSFVFQAIEPRIETYLDALWYCFAVVTTIGFGDYTVSAILSRALSVILGVYGIIVVALITSVIVNFYNEVKDDADDDEIGKDEINEKRPEE